MLTNIESLNYFSGDELSNSVWLSKYRNGDEKTPLDMHKRMAKQYAKIEERFFKDKSQIKNYEYLSDYGKNKPDYTYEYILNLFDRFSKIIPQGSIMATLGTDQIASLSNCFVVGQPHDSYSGIFRKDEELAQLMKRRGGVGVDISTLRPRSAKTNNAAKASTGAVSFMERFSNTTREVAQEGRRGALMITIDCRHPDVQDFINIKRDRQKVTGANISVMLRNEFVDAAINNKDYVLRFPCDFDNLNAHKEFIEKLPYDILATIENDSVFIKKVKAKEVYDLIVDNAWENAEPGQIFIDNHYNYSPDSVYAFYRGVTTNPCGEIFMGLYDACRLMCLNYLSFVKNPFTDKAEFDFEELYRTAYDQQSLSDNLIELELEQISKIINKIKNSDNPSNVELELWENVYTVTKNGRRTGNGFTALGDTFAALGCKYGDAYSLELAERISKTKAKGELDATIDLAIKRGPFVGFDPHLEMLSDGKTYKYENAFFKNWHYMFPEQMERMNKFGRRNVSWSTVAPTGSVSILTQTSSGLEPLFKAFYIRRRKVNPNEVHSKIDFVDQSGDSWVEYPVLHPQFKNWLYSKFENKVKDDLEFNKLIDDLDFIKKEFKKSPWFGSEADDIDWNDRITIQSVIQKYTTHSISSTINLPNDVSKEQVSNIYIESYFKNLKGVTIYRDGCRTGVLVNVDKPNNVSDNLFKSTDAPKRPKNLPADIYLISKNKIQYIVAVGLYNDKPYEVFASKNEWDIPKHCHGEIIKQGKNHYNINIKDWGTISNFTNSDILPEEEDLTRMISMSLRHGASINYIVEQLNKTKSLISFSKTIAKVLKKYIPDGVETAKKCDNCNGTLVYEEGCMKCVDCGSSKC